MPGPLESLSKVKDARLELDVPFSRLTTWKAGGPARFMLRASSERAVVEILSITCEHNLPLLIIGNGSNILASDCGFEGAVLRLEGELSYVRIVGDRLESGSGAALGAAVTGATRASLSGLEFAIGIPGTVGGALMTNAGAFSGTVSGVLERARTLSRDGEMREHDRFEAVYREPLLPAGEIVMGAVFRLLADGGFEIRERVEAARLERRATQPWGEATAGSVFKNPEGDTAGRLIDSCGLKGRVVGGARVSELHANFIINTGRASASDIRDLIDLVAEEVKARFDVALELEVKLVGFGEE